MKEKIIIVGYGSIGRRHEIVCKTINPEFEIFILSRSKSGISNLNSKFINTIEKAITLKADHAIIASPSSFHIADTLKMVEAGCNCLVEKPLSNNLEDVSELQSKALRTEQIIQIGYNLRYDSCLIKAKELIDKEIYGSLLGIRCEFGQYLPDWRPNQDYTKSVSAKSSLGGGILLEMSHEIDYISWIAGPTTWVSAWTGRIGNLDIDVEDTALLHLGINHKNREVIASISLDFIRKDRTRKCSFICDKGTIIWDGINSTLTGVTTESKLLAEGKKDRNYTYTMQFQDFLSCIKIRKQPMNNIESSLEVLKIIEKSRLSSAKSGIQCQVC